VFAWGPWPERLAALACLELGDPEQAIHHARYAVKAAPADPEQRALLQRAVSAAPRRSNASHTDTHPHQGRLRQSLNKWLTRSNT
jgi:hypothetical protein